MSQKNEPIVFAFEPIARAMDSGLADLVEADWSEVTVGLDLPPLCIDWRSYYALERRGQYRGITARRGHHLIGYNGYDVFRPKRHSQTLMAFGDAMYIDRSERRGLLAARFTRESHQLLKGIGVQWVVKGDMAVENLDKAKPRASFGDMLMRVCGYRPYDRSYILRL